MEYHFHKRFINNLIQNYKLCNVPKAEPQCHRATTHTKGQGQLKNIVHIFHTIFIVHCRMYTIWFDVICDVMWSLVFFVYLIFRFHIFFFSLNIKHSIDIYLRLIISYYSFIHLMLTSLHGIVVVVVVAHTHRGHFTSLWDWFMFEFFIVVFFTEKKEEDCFKCQLRIQFRCDFSIQTSVENESSIDF